MRSLAAAARPTTHTHRTTHSPLGRHVQMGGGLRVFDAEATLVNCEISRCEVLSSEWVAAQASAKVLVWGGGIFARPNAFLTMRGTLLTECRADNAFDGPAVRAPCALPCLCRQPRVDA